MRFVDAPYVRIVSPPHPNVCEVIMLRFRLARMVTFGVLISVFAALPVDSAALPADVAVRQAASCTASSTHCLFFPWMRAPAVPLTLHLLSTLPSDSNAVKVHGDYAYASDYDDLLVVDVRTPQQPAIVGRYHIEGRSRVSIADIEVQPPLAYVATNDRFSICCLESKVNLLDISQPAQPVLRDTRGGIGVTDLAVANQRVYVTGLTWIYDMPDLTLYDVVNASSLAARGTYGSDGSAAVAVSGSIAYLADYEAGIRVLDVSNADQPALLGTFDTPGSAQDVWIVGSYAYVADGAAGLTIFDISTPQQPVLLSTRQTLGEAAQLQVVDGRAYIAERYHGVSILDVRNPYAVELLATYDTPGSAIEVQVSGPLLYIADNIGGLHIVQMAQALR
jgi:hypothetical protein